MTTNVRDRDDAVARLADEVGRLGARLHDIRVELLAAAVQPDHRTLPVSPGSLAQAPCAHTASQGPALQGPARPQSQMAPPWVPQGTGASALQPPRGWVPGLGSAPQTAREPWWRREGAVNKVVAVAGSAVTLLGVVLLLVMAAQGGYFGPVPRVVGGAMLCLLLLGGAVRLRQREGGQTGAVALAGTGVAGLYLDVVAATALYSWLPTWAGPAVGAAVATGGLLLAQRWASQLLGVLAVGGAAVLAPVLVDLGTSALVGYLLVLQLGSAGLTLRPGSRPWPVLVVVRSLPPALATLVATAVVERSQLGLLVAVAASGAVLGVGLALHQLERTADDLLSLGALSVAVGPLLVVAAQLDRWPAVGVSGAAALVLATVVGLSGLGVSAHFGPRTRATLVAFSAIALFQATVTALDARLTAAVLLVEAVVLTALAHRVHSRVTLIAGVGFAVVGLVALLSTLPVDVLVSSSAMVDTATLALALGGVMLVVAALAVALEVRRAQLFRSPQAVFWVAGASGLYGVVAAVVTGAVLLFGEDGFVLGHSAATVTAAAAGLVLVARGLRVGPGALEVRVAGLLLVAAAIGKLVLFDLAALSGFARVAAFLVTGLLLLQQGSRVARSNVTGTGQNDGHTNHAAAPQHPAGRPGGPPS